MRLSILLFLFAIMVTINACQKEPAFEDVPVPNGTNCNPAKAYVYNIGGAIEDSALYEYANEKLVKISLGGDEYISFTYNDNKIVKRSFFEPGNTQPYFYQQYAYNTDGTVAKIESFYNDALQQEKVDSSLFSYSGGKLAVIKSYNNDNSTTGSLELATEYLFTYTGNNITKLITKDYMNGSTSDDETYLFEYDTKPNYFKKQSPYFLQTDPSFADADYTYYSFALSENNIIKLTESGNSPDTFTFSYDADSNGNIIFFKADNFPLMKYTYLCK